MSTLSNARRIATLPTKFINILDFGGIADGTTDNATALAAAKAALILRGGGILYFPAGSYITSQQWDFGANNIVLVGEGKSTTFLAYTGTTGPFFVNTTGAARYYCGAKGMQITAPNLTSANIVISLVFHNNFVLDDCWIYGSGAIGSWGIYLGAYVGSTVADGNYNIISNCYFGSVQVGIRLDGGANSSVIRNCRFQLAPAGSVGVQVVNNGPSPANNNTIQNCVFEYIGIASVGPPVVYAAQSMTGIDLGTCDSFLLIGNRFEYQVTGIVVASAVTNLTVVGNYYDGCTNDFLNLSSSVVRNEKGSVIFGSGQTALNYYSEGVFTPTLNGTGGAGTTTYTSQIGYYTRIGREVHVHGYLAWTSTTASGFPQIAGLPFTVKNISNLNPPAVILPDSFTYSNNLIGIGFAGTNFIGLYTYATAGSPTPAAMDTSAAISFNMTYMT